MLAVLWFLLVIVLYSYLVINLRQQGEYMSFFIFSSSYLIGPRIVTLMASCLMQVWWSWSRYSFIWYFSPWSQSSTIRGGDLNIMLNLLIFALIILFICLLFLALLSISYKASYMEKMRPFECGFEPAGGSRLRFCMKFFLVAVIFLIFDVEIRLILPAPFRQIYVMGFFLVLLAGTLYEWYYGGLDWMY